MLKFFRFVDCYDLSHSPYVNDLDVMKIYYDILQLLCYVYLGVIVWLVSTLMLTLFTG